MFKLTPEGRQRVDGNDVVRQTVPEFSSSNRESPTANSRQLDLWHYKTIGASRAKRSSTRQISDVNEWTEVGWRASVQDFVRQNSQLVLYALWDPQPVNTDKRISDVVARPQAVDNVCTMSLHAFLYVSIFFLSVFFSVLSMDLSEINTFIHSFIHSFIAYDAIDPTDKSLQII